MMKLNSLRGLRNALQANYEMKVFAKLNIQRGFAFKQPDNEHLIDKEFKEKEQKMFNEKFTQKEKEVMQFDRLVMLEAQKLDNQDQMNWWNKMKTMSDAEMRLMPFGFLKKYGSFVHFMKRMDKEAHVRENKQYFGFYDQVKKLNSLLTDEEKQALEDLKQMNMTPQELKSTDLIKEESVYYRRQPRVDVDNLSYNFEQFKRYTKTLKEAKEKDDFESQRFYKMLAYVKENRNVRGNAVVEKFVNQDGLVPELIQVPEEFKDLKWTEEEAQTGFGRKNRSRKYISKTANTNLQKYDAWRCTDRQVMKGSGKQHCVAKLMIAPAHLIKLFGMPDTTEIFYHGTGQYHFEDNNLDMYCLFDYKQTDYYHGPNREDEFYESADNLTKPLHKRRRRYPTIQEFWEDTNPKEFKLACDDQAEWRKFRRWFRRELQKLADNPDQKSFKEINDPIYGKEVGISHGEWDVKGVVCTDIPAFQYDFTYFMTKDELKVYKGEKPQKLEVPKMFDLQTAERVFTNKDDIKLAEMEREAQKLKDI